LADEEVMEVVEKVRKKYYPDLDKAKVKIDVLMISNEDETQCLKHRGRLAYAVIKVISEKDRAKGAGDAEMIIDQAAWDSISEKRRVALIDHELHHLIVELDGDKFVKDAHGRPKLSIKPHDVEFGWFDEVARRHGFNAMEVRQAHDILIHHGQVYFPFMKDLKVRKDLDDAEAGEIIVPMYVKDEPVEDVTDDEINKAWQIITETQRATVSSLQRRLKVSTMKATRIMEALEVRHIVGLANGKEPREILQEHTAAA